jgi:hypothetical protein
MNPASSDSAVTDRNCIGATEPRHRNRRKAEPKKRRRRTDQPQAAQRVHFPSPGISTSTLSEDPTADASGWGLTIAAGCVTQEDERATSGIRRQPGGRGVRGCQTPAFFTVGQMPASPIMGALLGAGRPRFTHGVREPARPGRARRPRPMHRAPTPELRSGEHVDGERHHLARAGLGQQRRRNRDRPPRPYRVVHQQHRPVEAHPVAHAGTGQQVPRPDR